MQMKIRCDDRDRPAELYQGATEIQMPSAPSIGGGGSELIDPQHCLAVPIGLIHSPGQVGVLQVRQ